MTKAASRTKKGIRIFLVDDHPLMRQALKDTIRREGDLTVCGEAEDRTRALTAIAASKPDVAIVDLKLKNSNGLELIRDISNRHPGILTLVLSMHDESLHAERAIRAGASGYISKLESPEKVMDAVRRILSGEIYWSEKAAAEVASRTVCPQRLNHSENVSAENLSERELQIFEFIGKGNSTPQIAETLHIDVSTVETYRARIKEKLNLKDAVELRQAAIRWNVTAGV
ncbi:MAG TPA: response regulator transcription factor [Verrucomicrobiae bacterium]|nr:response regulator transcription factor [Verrucomicrobiae bacterium]